MPLRKQLLAHELEEFLSLDKVNCFFWSWHAVLVEIWLFKTKLVILIYGNCRCGTTKVVEYHTDMQKIMKISKLNPRFS